MKITKYLLVLVFLLVLGAFFFHFKNTDPLPSWNDGPAKKAIIAFVYATTSKNNAAFVPLDKRVAAFDQDGTLWVEKPIYTQVRYCFDRVVELVKEKPELKDIEPFKTVLSGDQKALANLPLSLFKKIAIATLTGMSVEQLQQEVNQWLKSARNERWDRPYTELTYKPMLEVLDYLRANGYRTYIVTGGGQDFVRAFAQETYGIPPEQVIGTATKLSFSYDKDKKTILTKEPDILLNDNYAGKPEGIHLIIGRQPYAAFGNSDGDRQMLEYTTGSGEGKRLAMLVLHDDAEREYAYGPAQGLPDSKVGTFPQDLYDEAQEKGWIVISMKNDWKRIFSFEDRGR